MVHVELNDEHKLTMKFAREMINDSEIKKEMMKHVDLVNLSDSIPILK